MILLTNGDIGRLLCADTTVTSCIKNSTAIVDDRIVYPYNGTNFNDPGGTVK